MFKKSVIEQMKEKQKSVPDEIKRLETKRPQTKGITAGN